MKRDLRTKNRLAITLALILCFASMSFAQTLCQESTNEEVARPTAIQPCMETDLENGSSAIEDEPTTLLFIPVFLYALPLY